MANAPNMLEVRDLHAYYGKSHILRGVNLDVREGESPGDLDWCGARNPPSVSEIARVAKPPTVPVPRGRQAAREVVACRYGLEGQASLDESGSVTARERGEGPEDARLRRTSRAAIHENDQRQLSDGFSRISVEILLRELLSLQ